MRTKIYQLCSLWWKLLLHHKKPKWSFLVRNRVVCVQPRCTCTTALYVRNRVVRVQPFSTSKVKTSSEIRLHAKKHFKVFYFFKYRHNYNQIKICFNITNFHVDCFGLLKHKQRSFIIQYFHCKYLFSSKFTKITYEQQQKFKLVYWRKPKAKF